MATKAQTQGANARQIEWDERDRKSPQRTGSWLPLDALTEDDPIYAGTPQLQSVPSPSRQIAMPQPTRRQEVAPTRPQLARAGQAAQTGARPNPLDRVVSTRAVAMAIGIAIASLATYVLLSAAVQWVQVKMDDLQYGRPRTVQMDAYVGQNETDGVPSHFIAMNLNRRVTIIEMEGGDPSKVNTIIGPYLFGQGEDLTPVQISAQDLNGDNKADLIVSVKNEQLLYLNDGTSFKLATPDERAAIEKNLAKGSTNNGAANSQGVNK
jgi:hypothetical protein